MREKYLHLHIPKPNHTSESVRKSETGNDSDLEEGEISSLDLNVSNTNSYKANSEYGYSFTGTDIKYERSTYSEKLQQSKQESFPEQPYPFTQEQLMDIDRRRAIIRKMKTNKMIMRE